MPKKAYKCSAASFPLYSSLGMSALFLHRESTDSLIMQSVLESLYSLLSNPLFDNNIQVKFSHNNKLVEVVGYLPFTQSLPLRDIICHGL